jgi:serine/threonine protein kinase
VARAYGVYVPRQHLALRGLFIIDPNGVLQYQVVHNLSVGRSTEEVLRVLDALQTGGLCPGEWTPDQAPLDPAQTLGPSSVFGQYRIEAIVGSGAFGTVFRARDLTLERTVALKVLRSDGPLPQDAILTEARAAAAINHPNVCIIYEVETGQGIPMVVMEFVDGLALSKLLEAGPLPVARAAALGRQIAAGMAAAHAQRVVHGDLKPANILVTPGDLVKIMDFGLAHRDLRTTSAVQTAVWGPETSAGGISGTPAYMSPEQTRGEPSTPASDVFALGLILYEMVTGQRAVAAGHLLEVLRGIDAIDPERCAAAVQEPFAAVLRRALVHDPAQRRLTMSEIETRLQ